MENSLCRLCIQTIEKTDSNSLLKIDSSCLKKIDKYFDIEISQNDDLPSKICFQCHKILIDFDEFAKEVKRNQIELVQMRLKDEVFISNFEEEIQEIYDSESPIQKDSLSESILLNYCSLSCPACPKSQPFPTLAEMEAHCRQVHGKVGHVFCCNRFFFRMRTLTDHVRYHLDSTVFTCSICCKALKSQQALIEHRRRKHELSATYICFFCSRKFQLKSQIRAHITGVHRSAEERKRLETSCNECGRTFSNKYRAKYHRRRVHEAKTLLVCEQCGAKCSSANNLRIHVQRHHAEVEMAQCAVCSKSVKAVNLRTHLRGHEQRASGGVACDICGFVSTNRKSLYAHRERVHRKEKREFRCDKCAKIFRRKSVLIEHQAAIHTGKPLYSCPNDCSKTFNSRSNLSKHVKNIHTVKK